MPDAPSSNELDHLMGLSEDDLFEKLGQSLETSAIECLNQALTMHGGDTLLVDDLPHRMNRYIDSSKLHDVLDDARELASERGITVTQMVDINSVVTDNDAVGYVLGSRLP